MLDKKDWVITGLAAVLGAAVAVALIFLAAAAGAIPKSRIWGLAIFGAACLIFLGLYYSHEVQWIRWSLSRLNLLRIFVLVLAPCALFYALGWLAWPIDPYCYFSPVFGMHVNATNGVRDAFLLVADNPTDMGIEGVQLNIIEKPEQDESPERSMERTQNARPCNLGYLRAKERSEKCSFMIPLDKTGEKSFWLNIETKDFRFHEDLIVWWDGKQWQGDFDLLRIEAEGEKTIRKMESRRVPQPSV